ncbi:MAG: DMT family transporter [Rhodobiaceae bacterium]|nr:DMT family transporter [Rhodobiaceae bacterium]
MTDDLKTGAQVHKARFLALPPNVQGALWLLTSAVLFTAMQAMAKYLGQRLDPFQVALARAFIGLVVIVPFLLRAGFGEGGIATKVFPLQLLRGVVGTLAMFCGFYAVTYLPLADALSLNFARGLFLVPLAILILKETVGVRRIVAMSVGFLGVVIMLRPTGDIDPVAFVALVGAALVAFATVLVKIVSRYDSPVTLMFYTCVVGTLVSIVPAAINWVPPTLNEYMLLALMGAIGATAHNCFIRGYAVGETTAIAPFEYSALIFAALAGFFIFSDLPDGYTILGAAVIVGASLYIVRREAQVAREERQKETDG